MEKGSEVQIVEDGAKRQDAFLDLIERLATNPDADVEKIQRIMDMQEQVLNRSARQEFNSAMTKVQNKIELVISKEKNLQTHSTYADLKAVLISAKPIYTAEGFSLMFYEGETAKENHKRVCVDIMHEAGHTEQRYGDFAIQTTGIAGKAMMTQIHGEGSAYSYGRRYLTCMIFNIPTGDDDDGNSAGSVEHIDEKQIAEIQKLIKDKKVDLVKFLKYMEVESLDKVSLKDFNKATTALKTKKATRIPGQEG